MKGGGGLNKSDNQATLFVPSSPRVHSRLTPHTVVPYTRTYRLTRACPFGCTRARVSWRVLNNIIPAEYRGGPCVFGRRRISGWPYVYAAIIHVSRGHDAKGNSPVSFSRCYSQTSANQ